MFRLKRWGWLVLLAVAGCESPQEVIDSIVWRQRAVVENLPAAEKARMITPAQPVTTAPAAELPEAGVLALDQARRISLRTSPNIHVARARLEATLARIDEARSFFAPQINLLHSSARTFQTPDRRTRLTTPVSPVAQFPDLTTNPSLTDFLSVFTRSMLGRRNISSRNTNSFSDHSTTLNATWTIFDGLVRDARLKSAKYNYLATAMSLADAQRLLVHAIDTAYYQIQLGAERLRIARADEAFSRKQLADAQRRFKARKITKADVLNFEVRVRAAQADVVAAVGLRDTGRVLLAELLALPQSQLPDDVEPAPLEQETEEELTPPPVEQWIARALEARPDLAQANHICNAQAENIKLARGQFSPEFSLTGSWGFERLSNIAYSDSDQAAGMAFEIRWQLYTGGFRTSQLRRARADWWEAVAQLAGKRLEVSSQVRTAIVDLMNAQEQVRLQRLNLESAMENRRIVEVEYTSGKASLVRLNEAQRDYVETDAELAGTRIRLRQAWSDLRAAAAGYSLPDPDD